MTQKDFGALFITNTATKKTDVIHELDAKDCVNWRYADSMYIN